MKRKSRRPATDAELALIPVSSAEEAEFKRNLHALIDRVARVVGSGPIVAVALLRAGAQGASLVDLPHGDMMRLVCYALEMFPARGQLVVPTDAEFEGIFPLVRQLMHISAAALPKAHPTDIIGLQFYAAVSMLRYNGMPDEAVLAVTSASLSDAEAATRHYLEKHSTGDA
jgi:hypothetical protein